MVYSLEGSEMVRSAPASKPIDIFKAFRRLYELSEASRGLFRHGYAEHSHLCPLEQHRAKDILCSGGLRAFYCGLDYR